MKYIHYRGGYKYQLVSDYSVIISIKHETDIYSPDGFIKLSKDGILDIKRGYAWDGPSGPAIDTKTFMRGSLVHDALYQLMREDLIDKNIYRKEADKILFKICREDGMILIRASWVYTAVALGAKCAADPCSKRSIITAPETK